MAGLDGFWEAIDAQLAALATAGTVDEVLAICPASRALAAGTGSSAVGAGT